MTTLTTAAAARRRRIILLEHLRRRVDDELAQLRRTEARIAALNTGRPIRDTRPPDTPAGRIRAWAQAKGIPIAQRGTIPTAIRTAYAEEHSTP